MIYKELEKRNSKHMSKVIALGSSGAVFLYILVGIFGYAIFLAPPISTQLCAKNILAADFHGNLYI